MLRRDPGRKLSKRRATFCRFLVCGCGAAFMAVAGFGLLSHGPLAAIMIVFGVIGLVIVCSGALVSDRACNAIAEAITRDYES